MGYYVLGDQGQKYGPADVQTLNQWISEGRLLAHSQLEDEESGARMAASVVSGLSFAPAAPPVASNYPRFGAAPQFQPQMPRQAPSVGFTPDIIFSLLLALASPVITYFILIGGITAAGFGLRMGSRAKQLGNPIGIWCIAANILALVFSIVMRVAHFTLIGSR